MLKTQPKTIDFYYLKYWGLSMGSCAMRASTLLWSYIALFFCGFFGGVGVGTGSYYAALAVLEFLATLLLCLLSTGMTSTQHSTQQVLSFFFRLVFIWV